MKNNHTVFALAVMLAASICSAEVPLGHPDFLPTAGSPVGFRGDGTGVFPGNPPTTWDLKTGTNVAWKVELPAYTTASPIVVAGKVIIACEPDIVVCYDEQTGKVLWQQAGGAFDCLGTENARRAGELLTTLRANEVQGKADIHDKASDYAKAADEFEKLTKLSLHYWPKHATPTPTSDGSSIAIRSLVGPVVCYDMDGKRKWAQAVKGLTRVAPCSAIMAKGQILTYDGTAPQLRSFDAATGKMSWDITVGRGHFKYASPVHFRLGGRDLIFTDAGDIVSLDGKILAAGLLHMDGASTPIVVDGVAYANAGGKEGGLSAVQLSAPAPDKVEGKPLWTAKVRLAGSSPVVNDGLVYALDGGGSLVVVEAKTGEVLFKQLAEKGQMSVDASLAIGGGLLFVPNWQGDISVYRPGRKPELVAKNAGEPNASSPVIAGSRLYLCGPRILYALTTAPQTPEKPVSH